MKHYYTIETFEGVIHETSTSKKEAIKIARQCALENKASMCVHKICAETRKVLDYLGVAEFPYYLRNCNLEFCDIHFVESV